MTSGQTQGTKGVIALRRQGLNIRDACVYLGGISKNTAYRLMAEGLPSYTIGNRRYFLVSALDAFLEQQSTHSVSGER